MKSYSFLMHFSPEEREHFTLAWSKARSIMASGRTPSAMSQLLDIVTVWLPRLENEAFSGESGARVKFAKLPGPVRKAMVEELVADLSEEEVRDFHLRELFGRLYPEGTYDGDQWAAAEVQLTADRLLVDGHQVMDAWETPIMLAMVDRVMESFSGVHRPRVVELGWGMGISGRRFLERGADYTVVEAHPTIATSARRVMNELASDGKVIEDVWEKAEFPAESLDIVFFDAYPATHARPDRYFPDPARRFLPMLKSGGLYTYYTDNRPSVIPTLLELGFVRAQCSLIDGFAVPEDCTYVDRATKSWLNVILIKG